MILPSLLLVLVLGGESVGSTVPQGLPQHQLVAGAMGKRAAAVPYRLAEGTTAGRDGLITGPGVGAATITAEAGGKSGSSAARVRSSESRASGSGAGRQSADLTPNEPPGFTTLSERPFEAMREDGWGVHSRNKLGSIVQDATAPITRQNVYQMLYPAGTTGGGGDVNRIGYRIDRQGSFQEIYFSFPLKHSRNWQGHSSGVNKVLYVGAAGKPASPFYISAQGRGAEILNPQIRLQGQDNRPCGTSRTRNLGQNRNTSRKLVRGEWHLVEVYAKLNTPGRCDGVVRMWLDGHLVIDYNDVVLLNPGESPWQWSRLNLDPIWGGTRDTVRQNMWKRIDHFYISAR